MRLRAIGVDVVAVVMVSLMWTREGLPRSLWTWDAHGDARRGWGVERGPVTWGQAGQLDQGVTGLAVGPSLRPQETTTEPAGSGEFTPTTWATMSPVTTCP